MKELLIMFFSFFKIGAFTFGGGYAMIPLIEKEVVDVKGWISKEEFTDILVISQSFPGALPVNSSLFIGYKLGGIVGAVIALLGVILPSFLIILTIALYFSRFRENPVVDNIFKGITGAVPVLVLLAVKSLSKSVKKSTVNIAITVICVISIVLLDIHPVIIIFLSALYGIFFLGREEEEKQKYSFEGQVEKVENIH
ncbi:chromate transporter [Alkaliphilus oremlandii]|uniref:Chromate transporter n=1 Tax=Alkaliphilus oremlandii (strain OhILAs) TaxID=350688 RepID=A8MG33_ALKOO|nr:chromate transporter [Alkaliphilus oremlandii]ABW18571.1 Chromate transporter [Alkaliphilus oremlandii OhILAs]